ncbi:MAG TPA: hypothetical protein VIF09_22680 [Polyangiaceae bacterium]
MRILLVTSLVALVACGGAQKPAATEAADTSSLETGSSATTTSSDAPASAPASSPTATAPAATADATPAAAAPTHPVPGATGAIDGKPFTPKLAQITGPVGKDGRVLIVIHEGSDCTAAADASISLLVPYKDGYKTDLSSLKRAKGAAANEAAFVRLADGKKRQVSSTFKPTGLVTIVSAPTQRDAIGKMKIDLQSGDYMLAGDLDVKVCAASK